MLMRSDADGSFGSAVRLATNHLPFEEAEALWLVDVCDYTYREAAARAGVKQDIFARRIRSARQDLRRHVA